MQSCPVALGLLAGPLRRWAGVALACLSSHDAPTEVAAWCGHSEDSDALLQT